jgi:hypothetical protein
MILSFLPHTCAVGIPFPVCTDADALALALALEPRAATAKARANCLFLERDNYLISSYVLFQ